MYRLFLDNIVMPIPPSQITTIIPNKNRTQSTISSTANTFGEVNALKAPGLTRVTFDLILPNAEYAFADLSQGFHMAEYYLELLERLKLSKQPFQYIVTRGLNLPTTNMTVSLETYRILEDVSRQGQDFVVRIELKRWADYSLRTVTIQENRVILPETTQEERPVANPKTEYVVQPNDTLWAIAKRYLGDGARYTELATLNNIVDPNFITVGQVILIGQ